MAHHKADYTNSRAHPHINAGQRVTMRLRDETRYAIDARFTERVVSPISMQVGTTETSELCFEVPGLKTQIQFDNKLI